MSWLRKTKNDCSCYYLINQAQANPIETRRTVADNKKVVGHEYGPGTIAVANLTGVRSETEKASVFFT